MVEFGTQECVFTIITMFTQEIYLLQCLLYSRWGSAHDGKLLPVMLELSYSLFIYQSFSQFIILTLLINNKANYIFIAYVNHGIHVLIYSHWR